MSFKQQSNYAEKLRSSPVRKVTDYHYKKIWPNVPNTIQCWVITLDLTFLALVSKFVKFSVVFLTAEGLEDGQTETMYPK